MNTKTLAEIQELSIEELQKRIKVLTNILIVCQKTLEEKVQRDY